jgi:hypothetical protein
VVVATSDPRPRRKIKAYVESGRSASGTVLARDLSGDKVEEVIAEVLGRK